jgi:hypothetical protein
MKATAEQAFLGSGAQQALAGLPAPWELGFQMAEKNMMWNEDFKTRLITVRS